MSDQQGQPPNRQSGSNKPTGAKRSSSQPTNLTGARRIRELKHLLPASASREFSFQAGDVLAQEGATLEEGSPALLVVEGAIAEKMTYYVPGDGYVIQTVHLAQEGQFANVQSLIPAFSKQPAFCSIVAASDGYAYLIYPSGLMQLESLGILLQGEFRKYLNMLESLRQQNVLFGGLATKLDELRLRIPDLPRDPTRFVSFMLKALQHIQQLEAEKRSLSVTAKQEPASSTNLEEDLYEARFILTATNSQLSHAHEEIDALNKRIRKDAAELEDHRRAHRAQQKQIANLQNEVKNLVSAICDREADLAGDLAKRFPHLIKALETEAFLELTAQTEIAKLATESAERRLNLMHRGLEELCKDHPKITISDKVLHYFVGEEPPEGATGRHRAPTAAAVDIDEFDEIFREFEQAPPSARVPRAAPAKSERCPAAPKPEPVATPMQGAPQPWYDSTFDDYEEPSSTPTMIPSAPMPPPFQQPTVESADERTTVDDLGPHKKK